MVGNPVKYTYLKKREKNVPVYLTGNNKTMIKRETIKREQQTQRIKENSKQSLTNNLSAVRGQMIPLNCKKKANIEVYFK